MDDKDRLIVALLSRNARLTNGELARAISLSPSACLKRVKHLEATGIILGYRASIASEATAGRVEGWGEVRFLEPAPDGLDRFLELVIETDAIPEAHQMVGQYDFLLRFSSSDLAA